MNNIKGSKRYKDAKIGIYNPKEGKVGMMEEPDCRICCREIDRLNKYINKIQAQLYRAKEMIDNSGCPPMKDSRKCDRACTPCQIEYIGDFDVTATCTACAGRLVTIRGKYPGWNKRIICPTCIVEKLEDMTLSFVNQEAQQDKEV